MNSTLPHDLHRGIGRILVRKERWTLSLSGLILLLAILFLAMVGTVRGVYPFLHVDDGGSGEILIVEGWITPRRIEPAAGAFHRGRYQHVVVVRNVAEGDKWQSGRYTADYLAADLVQHGVPKEKVQVLFCPIVRKDRTYTCAVAVREWLVQNSAEVHSIDVVTMAAHTRRSRLLYAKAFGQNTRVGAIALEDPDYDPAHWWRTSEGIRDVPFELLAYLYVRFFFAAPDPELTSLGSATR